MEGLVMNRIRILIVVLVAAVILPALFRMTTGNGFEYIRTVDALQLLATGAVLGVALVLAVQQFRTRR
jgi:hypothetical protein